MPTHHEYRPTRLRSPSYPPCRVANITDLIRNRPICGTCSQIGGPNISHRDQDDYYEDSISPRLHSTPGRSRERRTPPPPAQLDNAPPSPVLPGPSSPKDHRERKTPPPPPSSPALAAPSGICELGNARDEVKDEQDVDGKGKGKGKGKVWILPPTELHDGLLFPKVG